MSYLQAQIASLLRSAAVIEPIEPYYEVLEKITLSGVEYFDLGYKVSDFEMGDTIRFEGIVKGTDAGSIASTGSQLLFSLGNDGGQWLGKAQNGTKYAFGSSNTSTISFNVEVLANVTIALSGNLSRPTFTISGSVTSDTETSQITQRSATPTYYDFPLLFGAGTKSTGEKAYGGDYTIKCGKIYVNGIMTKDFIPVLDSQMRPCLYDKISKTFTYAKKIADGTEATDTLTFKRWNKYDVDYISFTGTQYIDLGLTASYASLDQAPVCEFEGKIDTLPSSTTTMQRFVSAGDSSTGGKYYQIFINWNTSGTPKIPVGFQCGAASPYMEAREADTNWHYYKYDVPNKEAFIDDISYDMTSYTSTSVSIPYNIYIGARNLNGVADRFLIGSLKWLKWFVGGQLVRNFKPVVWHNADVTAEACLYDEVYNKMYQNSGTGIFNAYIEDVQVPYTLAQHDNMDIQLGTGAYINASGVVTTDTASCYTKAIPVSAGDVITLTVTGRATTSVFNKRIHAYTADDGTISLGSKGSWVSQLGYITFPIGQTNYTTQTLSVTIPSGVNYIRLSHALRTVDDIILETQCDLTITRTYEVGTYIQTLKTSTIQTTGYMIDLGIEPKDGIGYHIKTSTNVQSSNYVFGARKATSVPSQQSTKPILIGLTGSQTGATIFSSVMGTSATWKSDGTNWTRPSSSTSSYTYECSLQTYKENNELKFNIIGYNYTLAKNADRQTLNYTDAIDNADESDISTLCIGGLNANNILNGNNAYFFIKFRQPNTNMTLLPVVNNNNQFYFIDNKTKQTYQFYKVGSPTPTTDNIRLKKLDGTFINGTL